MSYKTMDCLRNLGFVEGRNEAGFTCLVYNESGKVLNATEQIGLYLRPEVTISGVVATPRTLSMLNEILPVEVESPKLALAWLSWAIRRVAESFPSLVDPGRAYWHLLPWVQNQAAYAARPACTAQREWVRIAIKSLASHLDGLEDDTQVRFFFDGQVFTIQAEEKVIAFPATGDSWDRAYILPARALKSFLPKRLMRDKVEFSVWDGHLIIGNRRYPDIKPG